MTPSVTNKPYERTGEHVHRDPREHIKGVVEMNTGGEQRPTIPEKNIRVAACSTGGMPVSTFDETFEELLDAGVIVEDNVEGETRYRLSVED